MSLRKVLVGGCAIGASLLSGHTFASDRTPTTRLVTAIEACRPIADVATRVGCYDKAVGAMSAATRKGDLIVLDREKVVERRRAQFGLPAQVDAGLGDAGEVQELSTTIRRSSYDQRTNRWTLWLADNTVWTTLEMLRFPPRDNAPLVLRKGVMGAFKGDFGRQVVQVKRLQ